MKQFVSLGDFEGNVYASSAVNLAPGSALGFNVFAAIEGSWSEQQNPGLYFGNTDEATTGWSFRRLADVVEDPLTGAPAFAALAFVVAGAAEVSAIAYIPKPLFVGRTFFLGGAFTGDGNDISFYINGARIASPIGFGGAYVPGASSLRLGVTDPGPDRIIGGAYSSQNFGNVQPLLDAVHLVAFHNFIHTQASAAMREAVNAAFAFGGAPLPEYVYDAWDARGPSLTTVSPLPNEGTAANGDLIFGGGATVLSVQIDRVPNFTGPTNIPIVIP